MTKLRKKRIYKNKTHKRTYKNKKRTHKKGGGDGILSTLSTRLISTQPGITASVYNNPNYSRIPQSKYNTTQMKYMIHIRNYNETMKLLTKVYEDIQDNFIIDDILNYKKTEDYKTFGFVPGQRLATDRAFNVPIPLTHHGIYIGSGYIFELAPMTENKSLRKGMEIAMGISPLKHWIMDAVNRNANIIKVDDKTIDKNNKEIMEVLFERMFKIMKENKGRGHQKFTFENCESLANQITTGRNYTHQGNLINTTLTSVFIHKLINNLLSDEYKCSLKQLTEKGSVCIDNKNDNTWRKYLTSFVVRDNTCLVDPRTIESLYKLEKRIRNKDKSFKRWTDGDFAQLIRNKIKRQGLKKYKKTMKLQDNIWKKCNNE
jgi:hypothetical protein